MIVYSLKVKFPSAGREFPSSYVLSDVTINAMQTEVARHRPISDPFVSHLLKLQLGARPTSTPTSVQKSVLVGPDPSQVILR